jgi:hypothetical protein
MLRTIRSALERHRAAVVMGEALVWRHGSRGVLLARHAVESPHQGDGNRLYWRAVVQIAERRLAEIEGLDTATRYEAGNRWARRRGSLIGRG